MQRRPRRFCSSACRQRTYRSRQGPPAGLATIRPDWSTPTAALFTGHASTVLSQLPTASVHCVVTSPPYFGLRDYAGQVEQLGTEPTVARYITNLTAVLAEVRRVLRTDGTMWLNLGDTYSARANNGQSARQSGRFDRSQVMPGRTNTVQTAPAKSLLGIPWRVAHALTDQRWILRNEIVWHKTNGLPYPAVDRFAVRHEQLFLFSQAAKYHFDLTPLRVPATRDRSKDPRRASHPDGSNPGDVWAIPINRTNVEDHKAAYPVELARRAIIAGCPAGGTVLDPFSGSGTTGQAALELGMKFLGIDLHADYNASAATRLARVAS